MNDIPRIIAHRGASVAAPENSISALQRAWVEGADGVECDVRLTADCQVVCIHDADTERVAERNLSVEAHTYEELAQLDVGLKKLANFKGERIPLLSEWLANVHAGKKVLIELKTGAEILVPLFEVLDAASVALKQIVLITFDLEMVRALKAQRPGLGVYWLIDVKSNWLGRSKLKLADVLDTVVDTNVDGIGLRCHSGINREMVKAILEADIDLNIWTVDDPVDARRYASFGVTSITTNCPEVIRYALQK
ncbi:glycerophosphodiester phosphodiesterase family protein [Coraliomargarita algicola]|uniref:Glycerophosphodiester phosphodiesterase family protein n=1 Tax=Coraliomargarita algicola TaxID=3092156 RepID=A0ABZ0RNW0_9BACT|nr:glycerophosphodiester phosphodiesterase family protein [Coraliomargarita sp. J2-16]WPJ97802.1 glycerophosphodiester phosphodiesterase family protein [Coraliomargarita sp. J2-16]